MHLSAQINKHLPYYMSNFAPQDGEKPACGRPSAMRGTPSRGWQGLASFLDFL